MICWIGWNPIGKRWMLGSWRNRGSVYSWSCWNWVIGISILISGSEVRTRTQAVYVHPPIQFLLKQAIKDRALRELDRGMLRLWWSCPDRGQVPVMFSVWGLCSIEVIFFSKRSKRYVHFLWRRENEPKETSTPNKLPPILGRLTDFGGKPPCVRILVKTTEPVP